MLSERAQLGPGQRFDPACWAVTPRTKDIKILGIALSTQRIMRNALEPAMTSRLDLCIEALRLLARSSELEATRLMTAELRIREFVAPAISNPTALRASLEELDDAVNLEAELRPREASFWQGISDFIARRLATLDFD